VVFSLAGGIRRLLPGRHARRAAAALVVGVLVGLSALGPPPAAAQTRPPDDQVATRSTIETRLAYVVTGDAEVDNVSKAGLAGLTLFLAQRTALEAGEPIGLDIGRDELAFYPLIYWPIVPGVARPSS
jgi:hypothetical protein